MNIDPIQIIKKRKALWLFSTYLGVVACIMMLVCVVLSLLFEKALLTLSLLFFIPILFVCIWFMYVYKTRSDYGWIIDYMICKHIACLSEGIESLTPQAGIPDSNFVLSKIIMIFGKGRTTKKLLIDDKNKKFIYQVKSTFSKTYNFSDIINYEVYENGRREVEGTAGSALIGGAFFGLGGMIVGSNVGRSINEMCSQLELIIGINDSANTQLNIAFINGGNINKSTSIYKEARKSLHAVCSELEFVLNARKLEDAVTTFAGAFSKTPTSSKEKLQELKEMLDDGLISQEDYEQKKRQILGL